jgi:hypothetical protein
MKTQFKINSFYIFVLVAAVFYIPDFVFSRSLFIRDITYLFHPWKLFAKECLQTGSLPAWNPFVCCGMPFIANLQSAVFYPFTILFCIFNFPSALRFYLTIQMFLCGLFAYLFVRNLNLGRFPATGIAIIFSFGGYILTRQEFLSHFSTDIWLFGILLFKDSPTLLLIALGFAFFAGHQVFFILSLILFIYYMASYRKTYSVPVKYLFIAALAFVGLISVQLLPSIELTLLASRISEGLAPNIAFLHSLRFSDILGIINPHINGNIEQLQGESFQWTNAVYIGATALFLAFYGTLFSKYNLKLKLLGVSLVLLGLVLSLGDTTQIYPFIYRHLFLFRLERYPVQFYLITLTGLCVLAALGLREVKYKYIFTLLIASEMIVIGYNFQIKARDSYFYYKPSTVSILQEKTGDSRFILSPGMEKDRTFYSSNIKDAWMNTREALYDQTCVPYHLMNAYGTGEPLISSAIENSVNTVYKINTPQEAKTGYGSLGVSLLLCKNKMKDTDGFTLLNDRLYSYIYSLDNHARIYDFSKPVKDLKLDNTHFLKRVLRVDSEEDNTLTWKEASFPGWKLYINGFRSNYSQDSGLARSVRIKSGRSVITQIYDPLLQKLGVILTCLSCFFLILFMLRYRYEWF